MPAIYLSCDIDLSEEYPSASFGYEEIPAASYVPPDGGNYLRVVIDTTEVNASPFNQLALGPEKFSGLYLPVGYQSASAEVVNEGPEFGIYTYRVTINVQFALPPGLSGEVAAFAKVECGSSLGIEYVIGGGAGYVSVNDSAPERVVMFSVDFHTNEVDAVTLTAHLVGEGPPPSNFWTSFIGSREIP